MGQIYIPFQISFKEDEKGRKYPFIDIGSGAHGRTSFRLWISGRFLKEKDDEGQWILRFPVKNARIIKTPKGNYVLKPSEDTCVQYIYVPCGYRGGAEFKILSPRIEEDNIFKFVSYRSPRGSCGISVGALVNVPKCTPIKYKWRRTGRLYGDPPEGITILMPDGSKRDFEEIPDGIEGLEELPTVDDE